MQIKKMSRNVWARLKQHRSLHHRARITAPEMAKNDAAKPPMLKPSRRGEPDDEAAVGMEDVDVVLVGLALGEVDGWTTVVSPAAVVVVRGVLHSKSDQCKVFLNKNDQTLTRQESSR